MIIILLVPVFKTDDSFHMLLILITSLSNLNVMVIYGINIKNLNICFVCSIFYVAIRYVIWYKDILKVGNIIAVFVVVTICQGLFLFNSHYFTLTTQRLFLENGRITDSNKNLNHILDSISEGILILNKHMKIKFAN